MNGVEILSSQTIYDTILPGWVSGISLIMLFFFIVLCVACVTWSEKVGTIICVILALASVALLVLSLVPSDTDIKYIKYKVAIDDSVSMNEFLDKYEILDKEGKIYTIRERNNEQETNPDNWKEITRCFRFKSLKWPQSKMLQTWLKCNDKSKKYMPIGVSEDVLWKKSIV